MSEPTKDVQAEVEQAAPVETPAIVNETTKPSGYNFETGEFVR